MAPDALIVSAMISLASNIAWSTRPAREMCLRLCSWYNAPLADPWCGPLRSRWTSPPGRFQNTAYSISCDAADEL